ncbi:MAG: hypothetical protein HY756_12840 [Nitrospirae bacterium]|nr:hypothetical protein [Nitrospirota bacterium]
MKKVRIQKSEVRMQNAKTFILNSVFCILYSVIFMLSTNLAYAQGNAANAASASNTQDASKKNIELTEKEEALKKEEAELKALRKDVEEKIEKYTKLLGDIEDAIKKIETGREAAMEHVIKAYESMSSEDAASRLSALDESTAIKIILKMKSKKAGAVIALMETKKAAAITEGIASVVKKFPTK